MLSLSPEAKTLVNVNLNNEPVQLFFDMTKYSSLNKIYRILTIVVKFLNLKLNKSAKFKKLELNKNVNDYVRVFTVKLMQQESFALELNYLKTTPKDKKIPVLVND